VLINMTTNGYPNSRVHCICDLDSPGMLDSYAPYKYDNGPFSFPCSLDHALLDAEVQKWSSNAYGLPTSLPNPFQAAIENTCVSLVPPGNGNSHHCELSTCLLQ
jgi:hypothetical protein